MTGIVLGCVFLAYSTIAKTALQINIDAMVAQGADRGFDNIAAGRGSGWNRSGIAEQQVMRRRRKIF